MGKARNIDLVAVIAAVVLSTFAAMIQPVAAMPLGFARWASIGGCTVSPVALLVIALCCAAVYLVGSLRNPGKQRVALRVCSIAVAGIAAVCVMVSLSGLL